ncbi:NifU family protein [Methylocella silvestris]|uniref:NifU family protein n=1 Tax=Methylocella silvestris TaxID=199596 RepID=A0A2J7TI47_METSI|nr:NifU family protein [Methylocella silvestris]PNG26450.1 NifU family protein [Methylocella silvestris]
MFIETETTPNPKTLKFLPGRPVMSAGTLDIKEPQDARQSPLAEALFELEGVKGVFFGSDFITVTNANEDWQELKPTVLGAIMEHFLSGDPLLNEHAHVSPDAGEPEFFEESDAETVTAIKQLIETHVRPAVANDGGDIKFRGYRDGIVYLAMKGSCSGCPSSTATLKHGIQNLLKHYVPDVQSVESI